MSDRTQGVAREQLEALRQENTGRLLLNAYRAFNSRAYEKLVARGYTEVGQPHLSVIPHIETEGTRITTLAERASMTKQAIGQLIQDLETQGFVVREPDPTDRRTAVVRFTDAGYQLLTDAYAIKQEIEQEFTTLLGQNGLDTLRALLKTLIDGSENNP